MITLHEAAALPEVILHDIAALDEEITPLEATLERLNDQARALVAEETRLRIALDAADNEPELSEFVSGADYGEAKWRWAVEADERAERIAELMGVYADALLRMRDFIASEIAPLEQTLAGLRERRNNLFAARTALVTFGRRFVEQFAPKPAPAADNEGGLIFVAGRGSGPTNMRPDPARFPVGWEFHDTTIDQVIRAEGGTWRDRSNRAV